MKRVAWLTDVHFNFVQAPQLMDFLRALRDSAAELVLISGDIAEATDVTFYLQMLRERLDVPVYFVLGNHDYYFGSIAEVRQAVQALCDGGERLCYLTAASPVELTPRTALVGHDGWADGRSGDYERSMVMMNDYRLIEDLRGADKLRRWDLIRQLGDAAARSVRATLPAALDRYSRVLLVTHVPPLRAACWYDGRISDDEWAPHFTCQAMGDALLEIMQRYPHRQLTVLCGHTHGAGETRPLDNMLVLTGGAEYGFPAICRLLNVP